MRMQRYIKGGGGVDDITATPTPPPSGHVDDDYGFGPFNLDRFAIQVSLNSPFRFINR